MGTNLSIDCESAAKTIAALRDSAAHVASLSCAQLPGEWHALSVWLGGWAKSVEVWVDHLDAMLGEYRELDERLGADLSRVGLQ